VLVLVFVFMYVVVSFDGKVSMGDYKRWDSGYDKKQTAKSKLQTANSKLLVVDEDKGRDYDKRIRGV